MHHSNTLRVAAVAAILSMASVVNAQDRERGVDHMTYWSQDLTLGLAYSIAWDTTAHRAHFAETFGHFDGSYVDDGNLRTFTLDQPLVLTYPTTDCNGNAMTVDDTTTQLVFRTVSGTPDKGMSAVVPIGYTTDVGGCTPGLVQHYGTPSDPGYALVRRALSLRPSMDDLEPGARIAGLSENPIDAYFDLPAADVVDIDRRHVTFEHTGHRYPITWTPDGWMVVDYGTFQRGYMRIHHDRQTGGEVWFGAEWQNGAPASIELTSAVRATWDAGFGDHAHAAHDWLSGLFEYETPPTFELFGDGTGLESIDLGAGVPPSVSAVTWAQAGTNLQITEGTPAASVLRTWQPLADHGATHFVLETEEAYAQGVDQGPLVVPRINWYVDQGPSTEPTETGATATTAKAAAASPHGLGHHAQRVTPTATR